MYIIKGMVNKSIQLGMVALFAAPVINHYTKPRTGPESTVIGLKPISAYESRGVVYQPAKEGDLVSFIKIELSGHDNCLRAPASTKLHLGDKVKSFDWKKCLPYSCEMHCDEFLGYDS